MPARSKAQQRFFGWVHAIQKGEASSKGAPRKVREAAESIDPQDARDFAATKTKGLPEKKKEAEKSASFLDEMFMRGFMDRVLGRV